MPAEALRIGSAMCGRFVQNSSASEMEFSFLTRNPPPNVQPRYDAAPEQEIAVVFRSQPSSRRGASRAAPIRPGETRLRSSLCGQHSLSARSSQKR
jgi:putative SOS response-associated peptidase YedK